MSEGDDDSADPGATRALAASMPRVLIADGSAERLAAWWIASRRRAIDRGEPVFARHPLTDALRSRLFEARRARWLERGLEGAQKRLDSEEAGLRHAAAQRGEPPPVRLSRLLLVSADGSERFYEQVRKLRDRFENRLEVLLLECQDVELGSAAYGGGRRARALLLDHKEAVIDFLASLGPIEGGAAESPRDP